LHFLIVGTCCRLFLSKGAKSTTSGGSKALAYASTGLRIATAACGVISVYVRYTDWELGQVLSKKDYFNRVVFYNKGVVQDKMKIYNKYYGN
jgi:hypothetical protein